jgi:hypothetical protein
MPSPVPAAAGLRLLHRPHHRLPLARQGDQVPRGLLTGVTMCSSGSAASRRSDVAEGTGIEPVRRSRTGYGLASRPIATLATFHWRAVKESNHHPSLDATAFETALSPARHRPDSWGARIWWSGKDSNLHGTSRPAGYSRVLYRMSVRSNDWSVNSLMSYYSGGIGGRRAWCADHNTTGAAT